MRFCVFPVVRACVSLRFALCRMVYFWGLKCSLFICLDRATFQNVHVCISVLFEMVRVSRPTFWALDKLHRFACSGELVVSSIVQNVNVCMFAFLEWWVSRVQHFQNLHVCKFVFCGDSCFQHVSKCACLRFRISRDGAFVVFTTFQHVHGCIFTFAELASLSLPAGTCVPPYWGLARGTNSRSQNCVVSEYKLLCVLNRIVRACIFQRFALLRAPNGVFLRFHIWMFAFLLRSCVCLMRRFCTCQNVHVWISMFFEVVRVSFPAAFTAISWSFPTLFKMCMFACSRFFEMVRLSSPALCKMCMIASLCLCCFGDGAFVASNVSGTFQDVHFCVFTRVWDFAFPAFVRFERCDAVDVDFCEFLTTMRSRLLRARVFRVSELPEFAHVCVFVFFEIWPTAWSPSSSAGTYNLNVSHTNFGVVSFRIQWKKKRERKRKKHNEEM